MCTIAASCVNHCIIRVKCELTSAMCPVVIPKTGITLHSHPSLEATELVTSVKPVFQHLERALMTMKRRAFEPYVAVLCNYEDIYHMQRRNCCRCLASICTQALAVSMLLGFTCRERGRDYCDQINNWADVISGGIIYTTYATGILRGWENLLHPSSLSFHYSYFQQ